MLDKNEKWINGYEGMYSIDTTGNVYSYRRGAKRKMKQHENHRYYWGVTLPRPNGWGSHVMLVHRLVAEHFIPNNLGHTLIKHKDLDRSNNNVENLVWVSEIEELYPYWENRHKKRLEALFDKAEMELKKQWEA